MDDKSILDDILSGKGIPPSSDSGSTGVSYDTSTSSAGVTHLTEGATHETRSKDGVRREIFTENGKKE